MDKSHLAKDKFISMLIKDTDEKRYRNRSKRTASTYRPNSQVGKNKRIKSTDKRIRDQNSSMQRSASK